MTDPTEKHKDSIRMLFAMRAPLQYRKPFNEWADLGHNEYNTAHFEDWLEVYEWRRKPDANPSGT